MSKLPERELSNFRKIVQEMSTNEIRNYVLPQLSSSLIGGAENGQVRLLTSKRQTREWVTPHSHRFDFVCLVLRGSVENIIFTEVKDNNLDGEQYARSWLKSKPGLTGELEVGRESANIGRYIVSSNNYEAGQSYAMNFNEIHSIKFSRDAMVLFLEGPQLSDHSFVLEPVAPDGKIIETFRVHPWMFET